MNVEPSVVQPLDEPTLFELPPAGPAGPAPARPNPTCGARRREPDRQQMTWGRIDVDAQLSGDHPARAIWAVIARLELSALRAPIEARDAVAGAPAIDPKLLLALWVYATSDGEGSAREIWRLTDVHAAYRWLCGGVDVGYHTLSDFRSQQGEVLNALITQVLALLMKQDLVDLSRGAQDGTRVRASAGAASFQREQTLKDLMQEARAHLEAVTRDAAATPRSRAAADRGCTGGQLEPAPPPALRPGTPSPPDIDAHPTPATPDHAGGLQRSRRSKMRTGRPRPKNASNIHTCSGSEACRASCSPWDGRYRPELPATTKIVPPRRLTQLRRSPRARRCSR